MVETKPNENGRIANEDQFIWHIWVNGALTKDADILLRWSRTTFFGGCPTIKLMVFDGIEYALFFKCSEEWTMKYALCSAIANYKNVKLTKRGEELSLEPFLKDLPPDSDRLLGDTSSMERCGGMC